MILLDLDVYYILPKFGYAKRLRNLIVGGVCRRHSLGRNRKYRVQRSENVRDALPDSFTFALPTNIPTLRDFVNNPD